MEDHKHSAVKDEAHSVSHLEKEAAVAEHSHEPKSPQDSQLGTDWSEEEEAKLLKRIDWHTLPYLCLIFGLSLLDRSNISAAYIAGMSKDLQMTVGARYSIALLVFFITYAIFELPSNLIIRRIGARWWLSFLVTAWGVMVLAMGFVRNWVPLTVLRLFLGVFEAGLFPGAIFIISSWYRTYETSRRVAIFYMASLLASGFNGIIAYGLSLIRGPGIYNQGWRWIFICQGAFTVAAGLLAPLFLGDFPEKARFLSERERHIATKRIALERAGQDYEHPTFFQALKFLVDWKVGFYCLQYFVSASSVYSLAYFIPIILRQGLGFSYALSQILTSPPYIFTVIMTLVTAWISDKYRTRWPILCGHSAIGITGLLIVLYAKAPGVRLFGTFFAVFGTQANIPGTLAYGQNQTADPRKKGVVAAAMITAGAAGGVCGSTIFRSQDAPLYTRGMWATIGMQMLYLIGTCAMSMHFKRKNKAADEGRVEDRLEGVAGFRYAP